MKTFKRSKTVDEINAACAAAGFRIDTSKYDQGSDYINFDFPHSGDLFRVVYSSFNGRFFGTSAHGVEFNSDSDEHDGTPWFDALLLFVYVPKKES